MFSIKKVMRNLDFVLCSQRTLVHNGFQTVTAQLFLISISFLCSFVICCLFVCLLTLRLSKIYCWEGSATTATYVLVNSTKNGKKKFNLNLKHEGIIFLHQICLSIQIIYYISLLKKFFKRFRLVNGPNCRRRECVLYLGSAL